MPSAQDVQPARSNDNLQAHSPPVAGGAAASYGQSIVSSCGQLNLDDQKHALMLRQAMSEWFKSHGGDDAYVWQMRDTAVIDTAHNAAANITNTPEAFAFQMYARRSLAFNTSCSFDETAWYCMIRWYAQQSNTSWWTQDGPSLMPDSVFAGCKPAPPWGAATHTPWGPLVGPNLIAPRPSYTFEPRLPVMPQAPEQEPGSAGVPAPASSALKWVGILAGAALLGAGVWYLTKQPEAKPNPSPYAGHTGYSLQETWTHYLRALRSGDTDAALLWYDEFLAKGGGKHAADTAMMTGARSAPAPAPVG